MYEETLVDEFKLHRELRDSAFRKYRANS